VGMELMARYSLAVDDMQAVARGVDLLKRRGPADQVEILVLRADGSREAVGMSEAAIGMVIGRLEQAGTGGEVSLLAADSEISPQDAALVLGISRPLVRRRMDSGALASE